MEEDKAAAYYDELTRKGSGAARFKQGLGFSSAATTTTISDEPPSRGSALPSSSSFLSSFVKASSNSIPATTNENENVIDKKIQLENIQNKLKKKESSFEESRVRVRDRDRDRKRSRSRERDLRRERSRSRSRSRSKERRRKSSDRERDRLRRRNRSRSSSRERRRRRSRSRSYSDGERRHGSNRRRNGRSRSSSPRDRRRDGRGREGGDHEGRMVKVKLKKEEGNATIDYAKLINGYDNMTPAERVKAKMKLQLSQTAEKDTKMGTGAQWERFDFNKDAPVDDQEIEAADDDAALVKHIGKTFRFRSLEAKKEDEIKNAHDEAMFGVPAAAPDPSSASESGEERGSENENKETNDDDPATSFINEKVLGKQQGSWRDRARKNIG